jgi:hypothetical protein
MNDDSKAEEVLHLKGSAHEGDWQEPEPTIEHRGHWIGLVRRPGDTTEYAMMFYHDGSHSGYMALEAWDHDGALTRHRLAMDDPAPIPVLVRGGSLSSLVRAAFRNQWIWSVFREEPYESPQDISYHRTLSGAQQRAQRLLEAARESGSWRQIVIATLPLEE